MESVELELLKKIPDNLGDILTLRYTEDSDDAYMRLAKFIHRRDVSQIDKRRAYNYVRALIGDLDQIIETPEQREWFAREYPSDV